MRQSASVTVSVRQQIVRDAQERLFPYVNAHALGVPEVSRVDRLLQLLVTAEGKRTELRRLTHGWLFEKPSKICYDENLPAFLSRITFREAALNAVKSEYDDALREANQILQRYQWISLVRALDFTALSVMQTWAGLDPCVNAHVFPSVADILRFIPDSGIEVITRTSNREGADQALTDWEHWNVLWLLARVQDATIGSFRRCCKCKSWFFAVLRRQRFCSERCRKAEFAESLAHKAHRRKYMIEYRKREKERAQRQLELARRKHGKKR